MTLPCNDVWVMHLFVRDTEPYYQQGWRMLSLCRRGHTADWQPIACWMVRDA